MQEEEARRFAAKQYEPKIRDFVYDKQSSVAALDPPPTPTSIPLVPVVYYDEPTQPRNGLSKAMRASLTTGQFWLTNLLQGGSFERLYWQRLDELCWGKRASTEKRVADFAAVGAMGVEMEGWVAKKLEDLAEYRVELGPAEEEWEVEEGLKGVVEEEVD